MLLVPSSFLFFIFLFCIVVFNCLYFNFVVVVRLRFVRFGEHPQWDTTDAEIDSLTSDRPRLSKVLPLKLEVGQNKLYVLHILPGTLSSVYPNPLPTF